MGDTTKQARLDNWAMFVMSRLQIFFNTTDYCDLTLQFEGNVQLKVHRVIMNACTEYFRLLEQECDMDGDILIMPPDLQADVILPIVNFMYTGILEYQHSIFERLYQTAALMNMTVLLKFLDAQRTKIKPPRIQQSQVRRTIKQEKTTQVLPGRKLPIWKRKNAPMPVQINPVKPYSPETRSALSLDGGRFDNAPKPTRFEWPDDEMQDIKPFDMMPLDSSFDSISYSTKPLLTQEEEMRSTCNTNVFDDLRQLPGGKVTKKVQEPKEKESFTLNSSMDMEDLKSYVKEQKIRSNLADFEEEEDPDDPDYVVESSDRKRKIPMSPVATKKVKVSSEKENIVEVRSTSTKVDHSKIISEVFKKYPHLVQKNKNIRLKILPKKIEDKPVEKERPKIKTFASAANIQTKKVMKPSSPVTSAATTAPEAATPKKIKPGEQTWECATCTNNGEPVEFVLYYLYRKHMTDAHHKQFDARECKHCGEMYEQPLQMTYHMYMAHAVVPPRSIIFPKCTRCSFVAFDKDIMAKHLSFHAMHIHHVQCANCKLGFSNNQTLKAHMQLAGHNGKNNLSYDCQYCTRQLNSATSLFVHCKTTHLDDAKRDGMLSLDDTHLEGQVAIDEKVLSASNDEKASSQPIEDPANIDSSLGPFDIVVLEDQQQFILQDEQEPPAEISSQESFMSLPTLQDQSYNISQSDIGSTDELVMVLTDHDYNDGSNDAIINNDNSNIVVLYSHPVDGEQNQFITSQGNIMLNSETGMLEIHNDGVPISTQGESIEMIQKEIQSHAMGDMSSITTTTEAQKTITTAAEIEQTLQPDEPEPQQEEVLTEVTPEAPEKEIVDDSSDKKDIAVAVEEEAPEKLINTVEEIEQDVTDFAASNVSENAFASGGDDVVQPEPEPMDIDEDAKTTGIVETMPQQEIITEEEIIAPEFVAEETSASTEQPEESIVSKPEILTEEIIEKEVIPSVTEDVSASMTSIEPLPEAEVPQELLEPTETSDITVPEVPEAATDTSAVSLSLDASSETENELMSQTAQSNEDEYKTSASLSVSEQCPEEPMEVDGLVQSSTQPEATTEENDKLMEEPEEVATVETVETTETDNNTTITTVTEVNGEDDKIVETNTKEPEQSEDVVDGDACLEKQETSTPVEDTIAQPVVFDSAPDLLAEESSKPAESTDSTQELEETTTSENFVEDKSTMSTVSTADDTGSLPELIDEPPVDDNIETAHPAQTDLLPQESTTTDAPLDAPDADAPKPKEIKDKTGGISTLLNDWEDTDSQTSEQGKAATVNKLINDWDDE